MLPNSIEPVGQKEYDRICGMGDAVRRTLAESRSLRISIQPVNATSLS